MIGTQIQKNKEEAFKHLIEVKKQNPKTMVVEQDDIFSYTTKRGLVKKYKAFNTFESYAQSELYPDKMDRVNGFIFVPIAM